MRVALASAAAFCAWCMLTSDALAGVPPTRKCQSVTIHATVKVDRTTYVLTGAIVARRPDEKRVARERHGSAELELRGAVHGDEPRGSSPRAG